MKGLGPLVLLGVLGCRPTLATPTVPQEKVYITRDERVDDWRLNGEKSCPRLLRAPTGCYVLEAKYRESYTRVHGGMSGLWGISWAGAAVDTLSRVQSSSYETAYIPFALQLRSGHRYYVTATFDGDEFMPRVVELNAAAERTREILPTSSVDELKACAAESAARPEVVAALCAASRQR